jgi:hypothetical protein
MTRPTPERELAEIILSVLEGRAGFDHWWDSIKIITQEEIIDEIADEIKNYKRIE